MSTYHRHSDRPRGHLPRRFDHARIRELYAAGLTLHETAKIIGCSTGLVWQVVTDYNARRNGKRRAERVRRRASTSGKVSRGAATGGRDADDATV